MVAEAALTRPSCAFQCLCDRFKLNSRQFGQQYYQFYNARYYKMYDWVKETAFKKWGEDVNLIHLSDLMDRRGERVCIIGCLLKVMKLQPSLLKEVSEDLELIPEAPLERWVSPNDHFSLQEPGESVVLVGGPDVPTNVTGIMVAVIGHETDNGNKFVVEDFCLPAPCPQKPLVTAAQDMRIMFVCDLGFSLEPDAVLEQARNYLLDFVSGSVGEELRHATSIVRVIVAGNCMDEGAAEKEKALEEMEDENQEENQWTKKERSYTCDTLPLIDEYLAAMGNVVPVDVMPGPYDVTSYLMPQQPLHPLLLPKCARVKGVRCTTNPYYAKFGEITVLGSEGRVVQSVRASTTIDEGVDILDETIKWRHMIPTAPDTVHSYPFLDDDPFVLEEVPHIYFAANQKEFNSKMSVSSGHKTRIILIPSFKATKQVVTVNLRTLACDVVALSS